jgi:predicted Rossmann fold nucleotide-binding protein DprA/Smf involved in DNA uptake
MNQDTINRLKAAAPSIEKFRNLHPDEQQWLEPMFSKTMQTALAVLDAISQTALTYEEIADECELHINSVKQILSALNEGGCRINLGDRTAFAPTGRPRNLVKR